MWNFSHHAVTLEKDKTIDIATMNVSIAHPKKRLKADDSYSQIREEEILSYLKGFSFPSCIHSFTLASAQY